MKKFFLGLLEKLLIRKSLDPATIDLGAIQRILVVRQHDQLGDFLVATPALRALRARFPNAVIGVVIREYFLSAAKDHPFIDELLVVPSEKKRWSWTSWWSLWKGLRGPWDLAIVLNTVSHSLTSDLLAWVSTAPYVLGSEDKVFPGCRENYFYNLRAPLHPQPRHQSERNLDIVRQIGADTKDLSEVMRLPEIEIQTAREEMKRSGVLFDRPVLALDPGAGKPPNRWPAQKFAKLANRLDPQKVQIILFWGPQEEDLRKEILVHLKFPIVQIPPAGFRILAAQLANCDALVCNDTGVLHVAAAMGVPLVAIFGPTKPEDWKPIGKKYRAIRGRGDNIANVTVTQVYDELIKIFKKAGRSK